MHFMYTSKVLLSVVCIVQHIQRLLVVYEETYLCVYSMDPEGRMTVRCGIHHEIHNIWIRTVESII
jgi:hypothetical protein